MMALVYAPWVSPDVLQAVVTLGVVACLALVLFQSEQPISRVRFFIALLVVFATVSLVVLKAEAAVVQPCAAYDPNSWAYTWCSWGWWV